MAMLDEPGDSRDTSVKKIKQPIFLASFLEAEERSQEAGIREDQISRNVEQVTQAQIQTVYGSQSDSIRLKGLPVDEQPTGLIPAVRDASKAPKLATQDADSQTYVSLVRNLVKSSGIYAIASLVGPLVSLVLAPFLTHSLSRTDYGALTVLNTAITLVAGVTQFGLGSAFFRAYGYDYESQRDRLGVLSTTVVLLLLPLIPTVVVVLIAAPWLADLLFRSSSFGTPVQVAVLAVLLQNLTVPGFAWLRAENRAAVLASLSIVNLLVSFGANIVLVGALHMGITGSLLATAGGYAVIMLCTLPVVLVRAGFRLRFDIAWNLLSFGLPLVFSFLAYWVLQLSDRYLLSRLGSLAQTASYGVAYTLGGALGTVVLSPFVMAWAAAMFAIAKRKDAAQVFQLVFRWYSIILLFAAFALSLVAVLALNILFPPAYHSAAPIIPIIATSIMFYGIYPVFNVGVGIQRKNWFSVLFIAIAALVNVGINLLLIPLYGSMGAAVSTLIAYMTLAIITYFVNQRIYPIPFEIGRFSIALMLGVIFYVGSAILAQAQTRPVVWGIYICALAFYTGCLLLLGKIPAWTLLKKSFSRKRRIL